MVTIVMVVNRGVEVFEEPSSAYSVLGLVHLGQVGKLQIMVLVLRDRMQRMFVRIQMRVVLADQVKIQLKM